VHRGGKIHGWVELVVSDREGVNGMIFNETIALVHRLNLV